MKSFWLEWEERIPASIDAEDEAQALLLGEKLTGFKPIRARILYYRGLPELPSPGKWPAYCLQPDRCAGHAHCMRGSPCDS